MAYTKKISRSDKILIDGTDVSNSFRTFGYSAERSEEDATGFSATGTRETLPGSNDQTFAGEAFYTEELALIVEPLQRNGTACTISWQPDGLADARQVRRVPRHLQRLHARHLHQEVRRHRPENHFDSGSD